MNICPCCGFLGLRTPAYKNILFPLLQDIVPPYEEYLGDPSYEVCPCCGFEFGNDDNPGTAAPVTFEQFRQEWISEGGKWFDESARAPDWDLEKQLARIGVTLSKETPNA